MADKIKVRFTSSIAGSDFTFGAGQEVDGPAAFLLAFVRAGHAVLLEDGGPTADVETAVDVTARTTRKGNKR